jgi:starch-binding outer membrane protein, SusD/RagB family
MKTTAKHIAIVGLAAMVLALCTDGFLDTSSKTSLNTTTYYKTSEQAQTALVDCYDQYQRTISNGAYF